MRRHKPDPKQGDLWASRGRKIKLLRDLHFVKTPTQKLLLYVLDGFVGGDFPEMRISLKALAKRCLISVDSVRRVAGELREMEVIKYIPDDQKRKSPLFALMWTWVDRLHAEAEEAEEADDLEADDLVADDLGEATAPEVVTRTDRALETASAAFTSKRSSFADAARSFTSKRSSFADERSSFTSKRYIRNTEFPPNEFPNSKPTPPPNDEFEAVVVMVKDAGIIQDESTVRKAQAKGLTLDQVRDVVAHFLDNPGRWPAGVLVNRLTRDGAARLAPGEGWYGERPEWLAQRKRAAEHEAQAQAQGEEMAAPLTAEQRQARDRMEAMYGPQLDAMTPAELAELLADMPILLKMMRKDMNNPHRPTVLAKLQARDAASREDRERRERMAQGFPPIDDFDDEDGSAGRSDVSRLYRRTAQTDRAACPEAWATGPRFFQRTESRADAEKEPHNREASIEEDRPECDVCPG